MVPLGVGWPAPNDARGANMSPCCASRPAAPCRPTEQTWSCAERRALKTCGMNRGRASGSIRIEGLADGTRGSSTISRSCATRRQIRLPFPPLPVPPRLGAVAALRRPGSHCTRLEARRAVDADGGHDMASQGVQVLDCRAKVSSRASLTRTCNGRDQSQAWVPDRNSGNHARSVGRARMLSPSWATVREQRDFRPKGGRFRMADRLRRARFETGHSPTGDQP
jgi:hypothetical protein